MKTILKTILFVFLITTIGCEDNDETIPSNDSNKLIGHWINPVSNGTEMQLSRAKSLKSNEDGFSFLEKTECVQRRTGWCGTPPITYYDLKGTWTITDSLLICTLEHAFNEGTFYLKWEIKSLDDKTLILKRIH